MTPLRQIIEADIGVNGPIGLDRYMALCLSHPEHGYYQQRQPFGKTGDFTTAPEISQMFGELVGLWLVHMWQMAGAPASFALVELGPGRGTLMADILRVARVQPSFLQAAEIYLLENSEKLRDAQREALGGVKLAYLDQIDDLPKMPVFIVANEFFDALPIRQFVKNDFGWQERRVASTLGWTLGKTVVLPDLDSRFPDLATGRIVESCAAGSAIADVITNRIAEKGGAALIIDYGAFDGVGDTFQAVKSHKKVSPFANPGEADLTAHVRFSDLVQNGVFHLFTEQGAFLNQLGIDARRQALESASGRILSGAQERLVGAAQMGRLFKVLALLSGDYGAVPGFEDGP